MSEAPERIWAWGRARDVCSAGQWQDFPCNHPEYLRADLVHAAVAAALTEAAEALDYYLDADYCGMGYPEDGAIAAVGTAEACQAAILSLITPDAQAALDRVVAKRIEELKGEK